MINMSPGLIVFTMLFSGYLTSFVRPLASIPNGMVVATVGSYVDGTATVRLCLPGGDCDPFGGRDALFTKEDGAPGSKGQEGTFMGYANMPMAIGWIPVSIGAGTWHEKQRDKKNLAMHYMETELDVPREALEKMPRPELVPELAQRLGQTPLKVQQLLFDSHQPERVWLMISAIGVGSIVGMLLYAMVICMLEKQEPAS